MRSIYLIANKILMWLKGDRSSAAWVALVGGSLLFLLFGYGAKVTDNENLILVGFAILIVCLIFYKWNLHTANDPDFVRRITGWSTWSGWIAALCAAIAFYLLASAAYAFGGVIKLSIVFVLLAGAIIVMATLFVFGYVKSTIDPCTSCGACWTNKDHLGLCPMCGEAEARRRQEAERLAVAAAEAERHRQQAEWERQYAERRRRLEQEAVTMDYLMGLSPVNFEHIVGIMFEKRGYTAKTTPVTGDSGVDLILEKDGRREIVQCKRWKDPVGIEEVQRLCGCLRDTRLNPTRAWLVTTADFTASAHRFAEEIDNLVLVDGPALLRMMTKAGLGDVNPGPETPDLFC